MASRLRAVASVLAQAAPVGVMLTGIAIADGVGYVFSKDLSHQLLYAGTALEIMGLATVGMGVANLRRSFGKPSFVSEVRDWFTRLAKSFRSPLIVSATGVSIGSSSAAAFGVGRATARLTNAPIEAQVDALQRDLDRLREEVDNERANVARQIADVKSELGHEQTTRGAEVGRLSTRIEDLALGGLRIEVVGLAWIALGCLAANIPDEIGWLLACC